MIAKNLREKVKPLGAPFRTIYIEKLEQERSKKGEVERMEDKAKLKRMLFITSSIGFFVFSLVVVTEIIRLSVHT